MLKKVLIANRGEIALRIIRGCRALGISPVVIYSKVDRNELHVRWSDEARLVEGETPLATYLNMEGIIEAAKDMGADAIHPGYGFLAENAAFAAKVEEAGLVFVGPTSESISVMGDKLAARRTMKEAGVPIIPGTEEAVSPEVVEKLAEEIGMPVMLKAQGGGGGKGIRVVRDKGDLKSALQRAASEAKAAFANANMYIEKMIEKARHVEVQILGDGEGNCVAVGERDCSLQRRNQKMIEEAPCKFISEETRRALWKAAATAGKAVNYRGAGTVECLVDRDENFYFLEMNTRLQVEHPVTEFVFSVDLVEYQLKIASRILDLPDMDKLERNGHAIEVRIIAENPYANFMPSLGTVTSLIVPGGPGVRLDTSLYAGQEITPYYDSMVGKLIVHGRSRQDAIDKVKQALREFHIGGITTNIPYAVELLDHPKVVSGDFYTRFMEDEFETTEQHDDKETAALAAAIFQHLQAPQIQSQDDEGPGVNPWKLYGRMNTLRRKL